MDPVTNHLIQLQELTLIRNEQRVTTEGQHLQQLDASIETMAGQLAPAVRTMFDKLRKKDCIVIAPISDGFCALCAMKLPISLVRRDSLIAPSSRVVRAQLTGYREVILYRIAALGSTGTVRALSETAALPHERLVLRTSWQLSRLRRHGARNTDLYLSAG